MKASFVIHVVLLLLEGGLAWLIGGDGFLLVAVMCSLVVYSSLSGQSRLLGEGTRLISALVVAIAAPFRYQDEMVPVFLCFIALPHMLAATQALWEIRWGDRGASQHQVRTRSIIFTVAFYSSLGLVFLLARGMEPHLSRAVSGALAVAVLLLCLPALDRAQVLRLKPAAPGGEAARGLVRRLATAAAVLGGLALLFTGPLASLSEVLVRLSPRWKMNPVEFRNRPPRTTQPQNPSTAPDTATRLGADSSARTGQHSLPPRSNIQQTEAPRLFIVPDQKEDGPKLLSQGPLYVRTHTFNRYQDQAWTADVTGGGWIEDIADGVEDQKVTLAPPRADGIGHTVYLHTADGYTTPAIQGVTEFGLPRLYAVPGDIYQTNATGDIFYHAVSSPRLFENLASPQMLDAGDPGGKVHTKTGDDDFTRRMETLAKSVFNGRATLADKVTGMREYFAAHYAYSLSMTNPRNLPPLENFLFDERKGHCDFFSSAGALLLRAAGIPTRVAYGYATREWDETGGAFAVLDRHAHSWTEVYFAGVGWTICEFTSAANVGQASPAPAAAATPPSLDPSLFREPPRETKKTDTPTAPGPEKERRSLFANFSFTEWINPLLIGLAGAAVLYSIYTGIRALGKKRGTKEERAAAKELAAREKQPAYFVELLRVCGAAGYAKDESWTPTEFLTALHRNGLPVEELRPLFQYHCQVRYEDAPADAAAEKSFFTVIRAWDESRRAAAAPTA